MCSVGDWVTRQQKGDTSGYTQQDRFKSVDPDFSDNCGGGPNG